MISACIITKNEANHLKNCLEALSKYDFEIIVVDTGSTDNSKEIAKSYTPYIFDFEWCNDFSKARNFTISKATKDYVLFVDSDEYIRDLDVTALYNQIKKNPNGVGKIHKINLSAEDDNSITFHELTTRLFPKALYHYEGRVHEQVVPIDATNNSYTSYTTDIFVDHHGYVGSSNAEKAKRNLDLLIKQLEEDGDDPYVIYQIGKCYYSLKQYDKAIEYFGRGLEFDLDPKLEYVTNMVCLYGYALIETKNFETAMMFENIIDAFSHSADFMFVMGLIFMNNARFQDAVDCYLDATKIKDANIVGVNSYMAYYNIGIIYECLGHIDEAKNYYKKAGDYTPATLRLREL